MQRLSFAGAFDECSRKPLTDSHGLRVVEVSASTARTLVHEGENPLTLIGVRCSILRQGEVTSVEESAKNDKSAHLELTSESLKLFS